MKQVDMLKVANMISSCWNEFPITTIQKSWSKLFAATENQDEDTDTTATDIGNLLNILAPDTDFGAKIRNWLTDEVDPGYQYLEDHEIVETVLDVEEPPESEDEVEVMKNVEKTVPHTQAFNAFTIALQWLQEQPEASSYNVALLTSLKKLAATKRSESMVQPKLTTFFNLKK